MTKVLEFENQAEHSDERLRVVYLEQAEARSAFALAFVGDELPRVVHVGEAGAQYPKLSSTRWPR